MAIRWIRRPVPPAPSRAQPRSARAAVATLTVAGALALAGPPLDAARAHTTLTGTTPEDGAVVGVIPSEVRLEFSGPVLPVGEGLTVVDASGRRVDLGPPAQDPGGDAAGEPAGDRSTVARALPPDLPDGEYVATWRVTSEDGHAVTGRLTFRIETERTEADAAAAADMSPPASTPRSPAPVPPTPLPIDRVVPGAVTADRAVRAVSIAALLLVVGLMTIGRAIAGTDELRRALALLTRRAACIGLVASITSAGLQAVVQVGALDPDLILRSLASPPIAQPTLLRVVGLTGVLLLIGRGSRTADVAVAAGALLAAGAFVVDGHQRVTGGGALAALDLVHVIAVAGWIAAVVTLTLAIVRQFGTDAETATLAHRVAVAAGTSLVLLSVTGAAQAMLLVGGPAGVLTTPYGRTVAAKVGLVALAALTAGIARGRIRRDARSAARLLGVELALLIATAVVTAVLVTTPPPDVSAVAGVIGS